MATIAYIILMLAFLCSIMAICSIVMRLWQQEYENVKICEYANIVQTGALTCASIILLIALVNYDFSIVYVASYTDSLLPLFYRLTAFWAGQPGSLLFWTWSMVIAGFIFQFLKAYKNLPTRSQLWYWLFYFSVIAFFILLMLNWSNPFMTYKNPVADGNGLNPLLQNPGMIFHPPLLFWGYGGFLIPSCLALAQAMSNEHEYDFAIVTRPFIMLAWLFLTAGIVLGAWWSYMELGWGGYWAWDPVENASLIPWLVSTAALHTCVIQHFRNKLYRTNIFLMALTTVSAIFATYLVRSGVVQSLHAFGDGGVGTPLLAFVLITTALSIVCSMNCKNEKATSLDGIETKEGFLVLTAWLFIALSVIILIATLYPVIYGFFAGFGGGSAQVQGLTAAFYNRVCLPLFALIVAVLALCPWLGFSGKIRDMHKFLAVIAVFIGSCAILWFMGYRIPVAVLGMGAGVAACLSAGLVLFDKTSWSNRPKLAAYGVHLGVALIALGISFSGPYKLEKETILAPGQSVQVGAFHVTLNKLSQGNEKNYEYLMAELAVKSGDKVVMSYPQRRIYAKWDNRAFAESDVIPSLANEFYATLLAMDEKGRATLRVSSNPLVNWMWIGGVLMCLFPLIALKRRTG